MTVSAARFLVTGRVQGVWFRASTAKYAASLGLTGYAENLADGSVEVFAQGEDSALRSLELWLDTGPPLARVDSVRREENAPGAYSDFSQR